MSVSVSTSIAQSDSMYIILMLMNIYQAPLSGNRFQRVGTALYNNLNLASERVCCESYHQEIGRWRGVFSLAGRGSSVLNDITRPEYLMHDLPNAEEDEEECHRLGSMQS